VREAQAEGVIALCIEHGFAVWLALTTILCGWAAAEQGSNEEGIAQIQEGLAAYRATGSELVRPYLLCLLAEACMQAGRFDDGLSALTPALGTEMHRLKGELLLRRLAKRIGTEQKSPRVAHRTVVLTPRKLRAAFRGRLRLRGSKTPSRGNCAQRLGSHGCFGMLAAATRARTMLAAIYN
jgi:hypothetical protein